MCCSKDEGGHDDAAVVRASGELGKDPTVDELGRRVIAAASTASGRVILDLDGVECEPDTLRRAVVLVDRSIAVGGGQLAVVCRESRTADLLEKAGVYYRLAVFRSLPEAETWFASDAAG